MRMRQAIWVPVLAAILLAGRAGLAATERPRTVLPIPQLKNAPTQQVRSDLVVRMLSVRDKGRCEPGHAVVTFDVVVANTGHAPFVSPASSPAAVRVIDQHNAGWSGRTELKDMIPPGGTVTVTVQVPYFQGDSAHMALRIVHPFTAFVTQGGATDGMPKDYNGQPVVGVSLWEQCPGRNP